MQEYKFFGKLTIYDEPNQTYELGGVTKNEYGIDGNGLYAILYFTRGLRGGITPHHCEVYKVTSDKSMIREELVGLGRNWVGSDKYIRIQRRRK